MADNHHHNHHNHNRKREREDSTCVARTSPHSSSSSRRGRGRVPSEVLRRRRGSRLRRLRDLHGKIKAALVDRAVATAGGRFRGAVAIDLGCGRLGDASRYERAGVCSLLGLDASEDALACARARLGDSDIRVSLRCVDLRRAGAGVCAVADAGFEGACDVAFCMFALHYFFESEGSLRSLLRTAAVALRTGGVLIGAAPDGPAVEAATREGPLRMGSLCVARAGGPWGEDAAQFGRAYHFDLADDDEGGYFRTRRVAQTEYAVSIEALDRIAAELGMVPVHSEAAATDNDNNNINNNTNDHETATDFLAWRRSLERSRRERVSELREDEAATSSLYRAFAYRRVDSVVDVEGEVQCMTLLAAPTLSPN